MTLGEIVRLDLIAMIEDDPVTFLFNGTEYTGTFSGVNRRRPLEIGGFEPDPDLVLVLNLRDRNGGDVFGQDKPSVGSRITINEVEYRVDRTEVDPLEECLQLDLRSKAK